MLLKMSVGITDTVIFRIHQINKLLESGTLRNDLQVDGMILKTKTNRSKVK